MSPVDARARPGRAWAGDTDAVLGAGLLAGSVTGLAAGLLVLPVLVVARALAGGAGSREVARALALSGEDRELVPVAALLGTVGGAVTALVVAVVWLLLDSRPRVRPWAARLGAGSAAVLVAVLVLVLEGSGALACVVALAGLVAVLVVPRARRHSYQPGPALNHPGNADVPHPGGQIS